MTGNTIICHNAETVTLHSNRLRGFAEDYEVAGIQIDLSAANSLEQVVEWLRLMERVSLHFVGSRDYVYHSGNMAEVVEGLMNGLPLPINYLPRTGNLRVTVYNLLKGESYD